VAALTPAVLQATIKRLLEQGRKLDAGNPNPGNLGSDFGRFGVGFWSAVQTRDARVPIWQGRVEILTDWRNAIAHQDFDPRKLHGIQTLTLQHVKQWRNACSGLARVFDTVMRSYLRDVTGTAPW
jgi:hypothetical protein